MNHKDIGNDLRVPREPLPEDETGIEPVVKRVTAWANEEVQVPALDQATLDAITGKGGPRRRKGSFSRHLGWVLLAASVLVVALSVAKVRFEWGAVVLQFGNPAGAADITALQVELTRLSERFNMKQMRDSQFLETITNRTATLENDLHNTTLQLIRAQEAESATRYNDIARLASITSKE